MKLDVFTTSMRDSKQIAEHLRELREGALTVRHDDPNQRIADLNAAGLVHRTAPGQGELTDLGRVVLSGWETLGVDNGDSEDELARQVVLADAGIVAQDPKYLDAYRFWQEMLDRHPSGEWFEEPMALYMASYLNATEGGFNPWKAICLADAAIVGISQEEWISWAASTTKPQGWSKTVGEKLVNQAVDAARRYTGRVTFCMALQARLLAIEGADLRSVMSQWKIPHA